MISSICKLWLCKMINEEEKTGQGPPDLIWKKSNLSALRIYF